MTNVPGPIRAGALANGRQIAVTDATADPQPGCRDVVARCEGCEAGYELDDLHRLVDGPAGADGDGPVFSCEDCGSPVYAIEPTDRVEVVDGGAGDVVLVEMIEACPVCAAACVECEFHRGVGVGWDLAVAVMAGWTEGGRLTELTADVPGELQ